MDKEFLHKVLGQIVYETKLDHDKKKIITPFHTTLSFSFFSVYSSPFPPFFKHCRDVYGLNRSEINYAWKEYKKILTYKIENGL